MNLLLDTHAFLWWDEGKLSKRLVAQVQRAGAVYVSAATAWEIAIKSELGKLKAKARIEDIVTESGFSPLPISFEHAEAVRTLPRHHADPFDRLLIAQAMTEGLAVVTRDERFAEYAVRVVWG